MPNTKKKPSNGTAVFWLSRTRSADGKGTPCCLLWSEVPDLIQRDKEIWYDSENDLPIALCVRDLAKKFGIKIRPGTCIQVEISIRSNLSNMKF